MDASIEIQITQWRDYLRRRDAIRSHDAAELEDHLREQIDGLTRSGLAIDEAFLIAVKRIGNLDALSREFAREHSDRLWKQLVTGPASEPETAVVRFDGLVAFALAASAAIAIRIPALFGISTFDDQLFYLRNASLFVLPFLAAYFVWKRGSGIGHVRWLVAGFLAAAVIVNTVGRSADEPLTQLGGLHLPIALWLLVGIAYAGGRWAESTARMDFIRFSGELFIYFVLIGLGGGVLTAFTAMIFRAIGIDVEPLFESWLALCGASAALIIAAWLVEAKQSVIENMAPVLTRLFTPLFALLLLTFLATLVITGRGFEVDRNVLIAFDLLLAVVLALLLYSISARDPDAPPGLFDLLQVTLVVSALLADAAALWAITSRIGEFGFTPNRVAALGENLILLVNLGGSVLLYVPFLRGRGRFAALERWQTAWLPIYSAWAAIVVVVFPLVF